VDNLNWDRDPMISLFSLIGPLIDPNILERIWGLENMLEHIEECGCKGCIRRLNKLNSDKSYRSLASLIVPLKSLKLDNPGMYVRMDIEDWSMKRVALYLQEHSYIGNLDGIC